MMAATSLENLIWESLKDEIAQLTTRVESIAIRYERAEVSDSIPAYTFVNLPTAANGGLGDNTNYTTLAWVSNGRKSGEGAGAGTGILAYWDATAAVWKGVRSEVAVTA
jgi:hypothetical protein